MDISKLEITWKAGRSKVYDNTRTWHSQEVIIGGKKFRARILEGGKGGLTPGYHLSVWQGQYYELEMGTALDLDTAKRCLASSFKSFLREWQRLTL